MLTEEQCSLIETGLTEAVEPRKVAAYLCLHMGLTLAEVAALRREDINIPQGIIILRNYIGKPEDSSASTPVQLLSFREPRVLPMAPYVQKYLEDHIALYANGNCFIMSGEPEIPAFYMMQNILTSIKLKYKVCKSLSASDLRNAFIRRCIQSGMDLYTLCAYVGIKQPNVIVKRFGEYFVPKLDDVSILQKYIDGSAPQKTIDIDSPRQMNLLILGAGSQGPVVKEIAEAIGIFNEIAFLDDDPTNELAIGPLCDLKKMNYRFPMAIASFGDSYLREKYTNELEKSGYIVPSLIHPSVTLSPNAKLGRAVVIEARCIVSAGAVVGRGALLSGASVVEANSNVGQFAHIGSSVTVAKGAYVPEYERIPSGTVVRAI